MTKAFLEPMIIKIESEKLIIDAFSKKNLEKIKEYNNTKKTTLKQVHKRVLFVNDLVNGLNHIDSIHTSIDDVCIEEATKRKDDIECHNIKLVNGDDVFSKIAQRLNA